MKKISFVILSYNSEKYLKQCIESVLSIKNYDIHIYITDNGSKDNSISVIKEFNNLKITLIELEKNYGTTISRNKALDLISSTDYICILDSDTVINEDAIQKMVNYLDENQDIGLVGPSMIGSDGKEQIPYRKFPTWKIKILKAIPCNKINKIGEKLESFPETVLKNDYIESDYLISACWIIPNNVYKKIGKFDEKIFYSPEDVEYCIRIKKAGYRIVNVKKAKIIHYYQRISKQKLISKSNITHLLGLHYVLKKYKKFLKEYRKKRKLEN